MKGSGAFFAADIARAVRERGGRALIVGGWVRDRLLGNESSELDMEVFGIPARDVPRVLEPFGKVEPIGKSFPVYKIGNIDFGLPRRESKTAPGHKGFIVEGDPAMTIEDPARRRDFTVTRGWDPLTQEYFESFQRPRRSRQEDLRVVEPATFGETALCVARDSVCRAIRADA